MAVAKFFYYKQILRNGAAETLKRKYALQNPGATDNIQRNMFENQHKQIAPNKNKSGFWK